VRYGSRLGTAILNLSLLTNFYRYFYPSQELNLKKDKSKQNFGGSKKIMSRRAAACEGMNKILHAKFKKIELKDLDFPNERGFLSR